MSNTQAPQAANQLLLSPYRIVVVSASMPARASSAWNCAGGAMSRLTVSTRSVCQLTLAAPDMAALVQAGIHADLDHAHLGVLQVLFQPVGADQELGVLRRRGAAANRVSAANGPASRLRRDIGFSLSCREGFLSNRDDIGGAGARERQSFYILITHSGIRQQH